MTYRVPTEEEVLECLSWQHRPIPKSGISSVLRMKFETSFNFEKLEVLIQKLVTTGEIVKVPYVTANGKFRKKQVGYVLKGREEA